MSKMKEKKFIVILLVLVMLDVGVISIPAQGRADDELQVLTGGEVQSFEQYEYSSLPDTIVGTVLVAEEEIIEPELKKGLIPVSWDSTGEYTYIAVLPDTFTLAENVSLPTATVHLISEAPDVNLNESDAQNVSNVITLADPNPGAITFSVNAQIASGTATYTLGDIEVEPLTPEEQGNGDGYKSVNVSIPEGLTLVHGFPLAGSLLQKDGWELTLSSHTASFIVLGTNVKDETQVEDLLESLSFTAPVSALPDDETEITVMVDKTKISYRIEHFVDQEDVIHFYEFVNTNSTTDWLNAYNLAKHRTFHGLTGYLATITSPAEQSFIYNSVAKSGGWLGGTRLLTSDGKRIHEITDENIPVTIGSYDISLENGDVWYWACGPEVGTGKEVFYNTPTKNDALNPDRGTTSFFSPAEPNSAASVISPSQGTSIEYCIQFAQVNDLWNDFFHDANLTYPTAMIGYYVEYSESLVDYQEDNASSTNQYSAPIPQPITVKHQNKNAGSLDADTITLDDFGAAFSTTHSSSILSSYLKVSVSAPGLNAAGTSVTGTYNENKRTVIYTYSNDVDVSFNLNYSPVPNDGYSTQPSSPTLIPKTVTLGDVYGPLPSPSRTGYDFVDWNTQQDGNGSNIRSSTQVTAGNNHPLYAKWAAHTHKLRFNSGHAEASGTMPDLDIEFEGSKIFANAFTRPNYEFDGWTISYGDGAIAPLNLGLGALGLVPQEESSIVALAAGTHRFTLLSDSDALLTAKWAPKSAQGDNTGGNTGGKTASTGDDSDPIFWTLMLILSICVATQVITVHRWRKTK